MCNCKILEQNLDKIKKRPMNSSVNIFGAYKLIRLLIKSEKNFVAIINKSKIMDSTRLRCFTSIGAKRNITPQIISQNINALIQLAILNFKLNIPETKEADISKAEINAMFK